MRTIYSKFDKKRIQDLPRVLFPGRIEVIQSNIQLKGAVDFLLTQPILGLDTETRPCFKRGQTNKVSLLQVSTPEICFLFRLNFIGLPPELIGLLEDKKVLKIGLALRDDLNNLRKLSDFKAGVFCDLQNIVKDFGIQDQSLQKLYANVLGKKISKGQQLSNWEADVLTDAQKAYAATDAWACIQIYEELQRIREDGYRLVEFESEESIVK